jgi:SAM-dependent methyltransferase
MKTTDNNLLCCPVCKSGLIMNGLAHGENGSTHVLTCPACNMAFPEKNGIVDFLTPETVISHSKRFRVMQSLYSVWYTPLTNFCFLPCGGATHARMQVLSRLEVPENAMILETGIGTGDNLPYLATNNGHSAVYGIDIQGRMLRNCSKMKRDRGLNAVLYKADAAYLPFRDNLFDTVFHLGAINIFDDKKKAIDEMIRVAKPGTKIVIADESEKGARFFRAFTGEKGHVVPPVDLIPPSMQEVKLVTIWNGYGYLIEFRKPS